ncbi:MAG: bifunctional diaminohydroxyphosphoribosylaminopyrimidine deaminase/5-amino-6-(5-phosphoribosylamino)uracil reductase RibD [Puia sp.]|nr:bifunctional diaminohydroxyphosphoribosylaminopyrimidine deaminase/5-amino-6-(5-phosphoribosylamino)uracil reductase RibD [Puia sp.]
MTKENYMHRCLELARLGGGYTAPNPMVGSVLVYGDRIIGEGYHRQYGQEHAEVNCIRSVRPEDEDLIPQSVLYVSLEPCAHHGKTPPCADLIIRRQIPSVVVGCRDPFPAVNGKGIEKLMAAGVSVELGISEAACIDLNRRFFTFHTKHRPYIVLKWAQSVDGKIASAHRSRVFISNEYSNRLVHRWRSEEASILVGTQTAMTDNPELTVRLWGGPNPVRLVIDLDLKLPPTLQVFDGRVRTLVFNRHRHEETGTVSFYQVADDSSLVQQVLVALHRLKIQSVLVEGGARLLQSFIDEGCWDEARVISNMDLLIGEGLPAPVLKDGRDAGSEKLLADTIRYYRNEAAL